MQFDEQKLASIMSDIGAVYEKTYTTQQIGVWYGVLSKHEYTWEQVIAGFQAHMDTPDGKFAPKPAHIVEQIEKASPNSGHITSDEAWAIALESYDESATVCITPEILQARSSAQPIMDEGDKVGARMAFKGAYERIMANPAVAHSRPKWNLSLGWDEAGRAPALERAKQLGRLPAGSNHGVLPPPDEEDATPLLPGSRKGPGLRLIGGKEFAKPEKDRAGPSPEFKAELAKMRASLKAEADAKERARLKAQGKAADMSRDELEAERARQLEALAAKIKQRG